MRATRFLYREDDGTVVARTLFDWKDAGDCLQGMSAQGLGGKITTIVTCQKGRIIKFLDPATRGYKGKAIR